MADWVRFKSWDLCLDDVAAVERRGDGTIRVYLRGVREVTLTAAEANAFLPRFRKFARIEDLAAHLHDQVDTSSDDD